MLLFEDLMFRLVVAMYLVIVTAAGPAACCCTLTRLTTRLASSTSPTVPSSPSCCHHAPVSKDSKDKTERPSPAGCPDAPGCPCRQSGGCEVIALPASHDEARESSSRAASSQFHFFLSVLPDQFVPLTCLPSVYREGLTITPTLSTDDLLYAFHILRC